MPRGLPKIVKSQSREHEISARHELVTQVGGGATQRGWEADHWSQIGQANAPDEEVLSKAAAMNAALITHDLDFAAILAVTHGDRPSVVQIREDDISPEHFGKTLIAALRQVLPELALGALVTVETGRTRIRLLPFPRT